MASKKKLAQVMAKNNDLTTGTAGIWNEPVVGAPTAVGRDNEAPVLQEAITALLIMAGAQARWNGNYWLVVDRHGHRSGASANADFAEWQSVLAKLASKRV